jgi:hypothetical protein
LNHATISSEGRKPKGVSFPSEFLLVLVVVLGRFPLEICVLTWRRFARLHENRIEKAIGRRYAPITPETAQNDDDENEKDLERRLNRHPTLGRGKAGHPAQPIFARRFKIRLKSALIRRPSLAQ